MKYIMIVMMLFAGTVSAHQMTPTYPKLEQSFVPGVLVTKMKMFNKRDDVRYYEIGVFDEEWNPVPFVTSYKILQMEYLSHVTFEIYIRQTDVNAATYVCSKSKLLSSEVKQSGIASKICSKFDHKKAKE